MQVKFTDNFVRNLAGIEEFTHSSGHADAFIRLLDELENHLMPNLERFPGLGRPFFKRLHRSVEVDSQLPGLRQRLQELGLEQELREYLLRDYLVMYTRSAEAVYLLAIKHHQQLSFDFAWLWDTPGESLGGGKHEIHQQQAMYGAGGAGPTA